MLNCLDGYMNIALENTEEYVNGVKRNSYGDAFVRGNNGAASGLIYAAKSSWLIPDPSACTVLYISKLG